MGSDSWTLRTGFPGGAEQKVLEGLEKPSVTAPALLGPPKQHLGWPDL